MLWVTRVASASNHGQTHEVRVYDGQRAVCECWKFKKTGSCHHQEPALAAFKLASTRAKPALPANWHPILSRADQEAYELANSGITLWERQAAWTNR